MAEVTHVGPSFNVTLVHKEAPSLTLRVTEILTGAIDQSFYTQATSIQFTRHLEARLGNGLKFSEHIGETLHVRGGLIDIMFTITSAQDAVSSGRYVIPLEFRADQERA